VGSGTAFSADSTDRVPAREGVASLTAEALQTFLSEQGTALAQRFLAWAGARRIAEADALDAMQQVVAVVQQRLAAGTATADDLRPGRLFLRGKRYAQRNHRKSRSVFSLGQAGETAAHMESCTEDLRGPMFSAVSEAFAQLSQGDRAVLTLYYWEGNTQSQAASRLKVSQSTYSKRLLGALRRLREAVISILLRQGFDRSELPPHSRIFARGAR
jgi:RNA polymerase sigma factor (sigma-70 family)